MDKSAYRCHETFRLIVMSVGRYVYCVSRQRGGGLVYQKDKSMVQLWKYCNGISCYIVSVIVYALTLAPSLSFISPG